METRFYIGDVHGRYDLLSQMIWHIEQYTKDSNIDPAVTFLGDIVDRGPESMQSMELVLDTLENWKRSSLILGNHDEWFLDAVVAHGENQYAGSWVTQGGLETIQSYDGNSSLSDLSEFWKKFDSGEKYGHHLQLLKNASRMEVNGSFVAAHAGLNPGLSLTEQDNFSLNWIRDEFLDYRDPEFPVVIHGHTIMSKVPIITENRISLDTGAYRTGHLTCMLLDADAAELKFWRTEGGKVCEVEPHLQNRGYGTVLDRMDSLFRKAPAPSE